MPTVSAAMTRWWISTCFTAQPGVARRAVAQELARVKTSARLIVDTRWRLTRIMLIGYTYIRTHAITAQSLAQSLYLVSQPVNQSINQSINQSQYTQQSIDYIHLKYLLHLFVCTKVVCHFILHTHKTSVLLEHVRYMYWIKCGVLCSSNKCPLTCRPRSHVDKNKLREREREREGSEWDALVESTHVATGRRRRAVLALNSLSSDRRRISPSHPVSVHSHWTGEKSSICLHKKTSK